MSELSFLPPESEVVPVDVQTDHSEEVDPVAELTAAKIVQQGLSGSVYNRIVQVVIYAAVILIPLFYLPWTSGILEYNKQLLLLVLASFGLVVWLLGIVVNGKLTVRTSPIDKGILAILAVTAVVSVLSLAKMQSIFGMSISLSNSLISVTALTVFYFLSLNVIRDRGQMLRGAVTVSLILALLLGLLQMFGWHILPGSFTHSRAFNTVGSLNTLGIIAAIALPLFAKPAAHVFGKAAIWVAGIGTLLSLVMLAILNWWVLWAVALVGMLAMIAFDSLNLTRLAEDYGGRKHRSALSRFIVPMVVIVLGAFLLLVRFNLASLTTDFPTEIAPTQGLSLDIATDVLSERLLFGFGPENFLLAFDGFGARELAGTQLTATRFFDSASEFFTMIVHGGILALLAFLLLLWCIIQVVMRFGSSISESVARGERAGIAAQSSGTLAAIIAMTAAFFLYPFNITLVFVWYIFLALAALTVFGDRQRTVDIEERPVWSLSASMGFIIGLILVLTGVYFTSVNYLGDVQYAKATKAETADESLQALARAINLNDGNARYYRDASQMTLVVLSNELNATGTDPDRAQRVQNLIASAVQIAQRATQLGPDDSLNWANLARIYQSLTGVVEDVEPLAEEAFQKASDLRPGDPTFDNEAGQMWLTRANLIQQVRQSNNSAQLLEQYEESLDRAEEAFKRALEKSSTFGFAIYNLGAVYDRKNQVADAITQLEKLIPANPNEPILMFELGLLYARANRSNEALIVMQRAVLLAPQYANARWYLALLLEEQGDIAGALANLRAIEDANQDNEILQAKIDQLDTVPPVTSEGEAIDTEPLQ